jgi:peptide/nickel transport system permease protein
MTTGTDSLLIDAGGTLAGDVAEPSDAQRLKSRILRRIIANPRTILGLILLALPVALAIVGPLIARHGATTQSLRNALQGPSGDHWLGTDEFGRDIFARLASGSRVSMTAALIAVSVASFVGYTLGFLASFKRGWVDAVLSRVADGLLAMPGLILVFAIIGILGPGLRNAMIALGLVVSPSTFRLARATSLDLGTRTFVEAARSSGCTARSILRTHIVPNAAGPLLVQVTFLAGVAIVAEASLSFLGLGVQLPQASWGSMTNTAFVQFRENSWPLFPPVFMITVSVLGLSMLGDAMSEALGRDRGGRS